MARKAPKLAFMRRVQAQIFPREQLTRRGRATRDYRDGKLAQTVIKFSTEDEVDALREKLRRYLKPHCYKGTGVRRLEPKEQKWLLTTLVEAYYTEGYNDVVNRMGIDDAIEELVARRVVPEPWSDEYKGKGLYNGQLGSQEKAQERIVKAREANNATQRAKAIEAREKNLDGGAAAPGLERMASYACQKTRGSDTEARKKKVEPPKNCDQGAFLQKHRRPVTGLCDGCERPLASSIDALGLRVPVEFEHVNGGEHAGRLRSRCTTDKGCNHAARSDIDAMNRSLHAAGQPPLTAEVAEKLGKLHLAACYRLPRSDPDYNDLMREVKALQAAAAAATCTERDRRATVASETRSGGTDLGGRVAAMALERERRAEHPSRQPKAQEALVAKKRQEAAAKKAKLEARREAARKAAKKPSAPPAFRKFALPPAPAPALAKRKSVAVKRHDPASMLTPYEAEGKRRAAARAASKPAKRAAPPSAKPGKRARR